MTVSCPREEEIDLSAGEIKARGLISHHAYSLLDTGGGPTLEWCGRRSFMRLRNPWGHDEWNGAWSDGSGLWAEHPEAAQAVGYAPGGSKDDGTFFMAFEDFAQIFDIVDLLPKSMR